MRRVFILGLVLAAAAWFASAPPRLCAQEVIDRIVARVENDIILLSDVRALARYQQLVDGKSESDAQILDRLVDQWIVRNEADTAQFPHPSDADVTAAVERVQKSFTSDAEYDARKKELGLHDADVKKMAAAQLYLSNYLDSRFRPSVKVDAKDVEDFYQKAVIPRAQARGQAPPSLDAARDYIHEALVQMGINQQTDRWLTESRGRLHVEKLLDEGTKGT
jgi:hypothetical protein